MYSTRWRRRVAGPSAAIAYDSRPMRHDRVEAAFPFRAVGAAIPRRRVSAERGVADQLCAEPGAVDGGEVGGPGSEVCGSGASRGGEDPGSGDRPHGHVADPGRRPDVCGLGREAP